VLADGEKMRYVAPSHFDTETLVKNNHKEKYLGHRLDRQTCQNVLEAEGVLLNVYCNSSIRISCELLLHDSYVCNIR
jgi:hypothetical protein